MHLLTLLSGRSKVEFDEAPECKSSPQMQIFASAFYLNRIFRLNL
jgi:hypothetical protein